MRLLLLLALAVSVLSALSEERLPKDVVAQEYQVILFFDSRPGDSLKISSKFNGNVCIKMACKNNMERIELHAKKKYGLSYDYGTVTLKNLGNNKSIKIDTSAIYYKISSDTLVIPTRSLPPGSYKLCISYKGLIKESYGYYKWEGQMTHDLNVINDAAYVIATNSPDQIAFPSFDDFAVVDQVRLSLKVNCVWKKVTTFSNNLAVKVTPRSMLEFRPLWNTYCTFEYVMKNIAVSSVSFAVTNLVYESMNKELSAESKINFMHTQQKFKPGWNSQVQYISPAFESLSKARLPSSTLFSTFLKDEIFLILPGVKKTTSFKQGLTLISDDEATPAPDLAYWEYAILERLYAILLAGIVRQNSFESTVFFRAVGKLSLDIQKDPLVLTDETTFMNNLNYGIPARATTTLPGRMLDSVELWNYVGVKYETDVVRSVFLDENKAYLILSTIHNYLRAMQSSKTFYDVVCKFIVENRNSIVGPRDFGIVLNFLLKMEYPTPTDCNWSCYLESWTSKKGYPLVTVTAQDGGNFKVTQTPFFGKHAMQKLQTTERNNEELCWPILLPYTKLDSNSERESEKWTWVTCDKKRQTEKQFEIESANPTENVYLFNIGYKSLLRVQYDKSTWEKIHKLIVNGNFQYNKSIVRAHWIHDAFTLAWLGYQDYEYAFRTLKIANLDDIITWNAFFTSAQGLNEILKTNLQTYALFNDFIKSVLTDQYLSTYKNVEDIFGKVMKVVPLPKNDAFDLVHFWSCTIGRITSCTSAAIQVYDELFMKASGHFDIYVSATRVLNMVYTVLCTVLAEANASVQQDMTRYRRYFLVTTMFSQGPTPEKYLGALRCVRDVNILTSVSETNIFNWMRRGEYDGYEYEYVKAKTLLYLAEGTFTFPEAFKFFISDTQIVIKICKYREDILMDIVLTLAYKSDSAQLQEMKGIIEETPELKSNPDVMKAFEDGKAASKEKEDWFENNETKIKTLMEGYAKL